MGKVGRRRESGGMGEDANLYRVVHNLLEALISYLLTPSWDELSIIN
jgi:hypothetical protein